MNLSEKAGSIFLNFIATIVVLSGASTTWGQCVTCPGDLTGDNARNGRDVRGFTGCIIAGGAAVGPCACADMNGDTSLTVAGDLAPFVTTLLTNTGPCTSQTLTLMLEDPLVGIGRTIDGTVCLAGPAPAGGVSVTLASLNNGIATISPLMLTIPAGQICAAVSVTGVSLGSTSVTANATGYAPGTASITVTTAIISIGFGLQLIPGQTAGLPLSLSQPAPAGGVTVTLVSSNPAVATVTPSVFVPAGQQTPAANPQVTGVTLGIVDITASTSGFAPDTRTIPVAANVITLNPTTLNVVQSLTANMVVQLQVAAPAGGQIIDLTTDNVSIATVPATVTVNAGETSANAIVTGVALGSTTLRASRVASGIPQTTATVVVGPAGINLTGDTIGEDLEVPSFGTLTANAPAGNLLVTLTSSNPARLLLSTKPSAPGTPTIQVTVPAGSTTMPAFYVHALDHSGFESVTASAPGYSPGSANFSMAPSGLIIWSPGVINTVIGLPATVVQLRSVRLNPATGQYVFWQSVRGGLSIPVTLNTTVASVGILTPVPATFNGGDVSQNINFTPSAAGSTVLSIATPGGWNTPSHLQSITANVSSQGIVLGPMTVGRDLQDAEFGTLTSPAPAGNLLVTITSADNTRVRVSSDPLVLGGAGGTTVTVPAGSITMPAFYVQALASSGTVNITATAPGYGPGTTTITLEPSGFVIWVPSVINTVVGQPSTGIQLRPVRLNPSTLNYSATLAVRGGLTVNVDLLSGTPSVGTITQTPLVFTPNANLANTAFHPVSGGTSTLTVATPAGWTTPANFQSIQANVSSQGIVLPAVTVGEDLQESFNGSITSPAPAGNLLVTVTSTNPAKALVSNSATVPGGVSTTVTVGAGTTNMPAVYVQALDKTGTVDLTATAPGYGSGTSTVTLAKSGFIIWTPNVINTNAFAGNSTVQVRAVYLNAALQYVANQAVRAGLSVNVPMTSSDTNVGVIVGSPAAFNGNDFFKNFGFDPLIAGVTTLTVVTPAGWDTPSHLQTIQANVAAPRIFVSSMTLGEDLQEAQSITLENAPPNPVSVTVSVNDPSIATISTNPLVAGGGVLTFLSVTGTVLPPIYVQGRLQGSATSLLVQAAGYSDGTATVTVRPSGFVIWVPSVINTTSFSANTTVQIRPVYLNPVTLNYVANQAVRGGASANVSLASSNSSVGAIIGSPAAIGPNELLENLSFDPANAGTCNLTLSTPAGWDTPSNFQQIVANVTARNINLSNVVVGEDLQEATSLTLAATPPVPTDVTVTIGNPAAASISTSPTALGSSSITFPGVTTANVGTLYVHGLTQGIDTTLNVTAAGYNPLSATVSVRPSGFIIWTPSSITTTTYSTPPVVQIRPVRLNPTTLNYEANQPVRAGATANVTVTSSSGTVGTITGSPAGFSANELSKNLNFAPAAVGVCNINVSAPAGWDTPSNLQQIPATVNLPKINLTALSVGEDLQESMSVTLEAAPPGPVNVTISSNNPAIAVVSTDPLLAGGTSVTFNGINSAAVGTIYVQGLTKGLSTTLAGTAAGYGPSSAAINVHPSGFIIWSPGNFNTTAAAANTNVQIRPTRLDPVTLNHAANQAIRGGASANVSLSNSNATAGVLTVNPLVFSANSLLANTAFDPNMAGSSTIAMISLAGWDTPSNLQQIVATVSP